MIDPRNEEQAALAALGWADDPTGLAQVATRDPEIAESLREFADVLASVAYDVPQKAPPAALLNRILDAVGTAPTPVAAQRSLREPEPMPHKRASWFPTWAIVPYALAATLLGLAVFQAGIIRQLHSSRAPSLVVAPPEAPIAFRDPVTKVVLVKLEPTNNHGLAQVMVVWDPKMCCGLLSLEKMPEAPKGRDYQLWVLDPSKPAPVNAGVVPHGVVAQHFDAAQVHMPGRPGFALSMEPAGGRTQPTPGQILFAVAPSP